jgi:hypothetical protein
MSKCKSIVATAVILSLLACSADTVSIETESDAGSRIDDQGGEQVSSTAQPLVVDGEGCSEWLRWSVREMQTEITQLVWNAAYEYMENPWSELAIRSFGTPDQGQYDTVVDKLRTLTLGLDADREFGPGVIYECNQTGHKMCPSSTTKASVDHLRTDEWRVHLCPGFFEIPALVGKSEPYGLGYQYQRAVLLHEYLHLVGMDDSGGYCECALQTATVSAEWAAGNADNYALFITSLANVRSSCELPRVGC